MSKRILLIAHVDSVFTKRYVEHVLLPDGWDIVIAPIWSQGGKFDQWFLSKGVTLYQDTHRLPIIRHIPRIRMWVRILTNARSLTALGPFDAIHNHYLSQRDLALGKALKRRFPAARWVCSFWGSDLLRATKAQYRKMAASLHACDRISVVSQPDIKRIHQQFGKKCAQKTSVCVFGVDFFDDIDRLRQEADRAACKAHLGLPPHQTLISLGYNASSTHRHLELLDVLSTLPSETLENLSVVLPMTYGAAKDGYIDRVRNAAALLPCRTLVLTTFMDGTETAYLRLATDVFILAIPTDAFSASLQEYLYAGAKVLSADWLEYQQLQTLQIPLIRFHDLSQIPEQLQKILADPIPARELRNRAKLKTHFSWNGQRDSWLSLYDAT